MADMTATQREALSGMNLSDHEKRMKELEAELEAVKARIAETKANIANLKADQKLIESAQPPKEEIPFAPDRGLTGIRDEDGTLIPESAKDSELVEVPEIPDEESTRERTKEEEEIYQALLEGKELTDEQYEITNQMSREDFEATGIPFVDKKVFTEDADIEGDERKDEMSEKMRHGGIDPEEGRTKPVESDARSEKPGWETKEGSNTWSINEKDDYWKTEEGYEEAINLYGDKPGWLKAEDVGTLVYNPSTGEYEEVEEEEFEDLSRPAISADIKKLFG